MKINFSTIKEAVEVAVKAAMVSDAWPKFIQAHLRGVDEISVDGSFSTPVGHYLDVGSNDDLLVVNVKLTGKLCDFVGGLMQFGPGGALADAVTGALEDESRGRDLRGASITCREVSEVANGGGKRFDVTAVATLSIKSCTLSREVLIDQRSKVVAKLARLEENYPGLVAEAKGLHERRKVQLEQEHVHQLSEMDARYEKEAAELAREIAALDRQLQPGVAQEIDQSNGTITH